MDQVFSLMRNSVELCLLVGAVTVILYLLGYLYIYKRCLQGRKCLSVAQGFFMMMFFMYLVVVLVATILSRGATENHSMNLSLLSSYRSAWNSFSISEWRVIILNIIMFVPIGFLLPLSFPKCKKCYITYLVGAIFTLAIESEQYVSNQGIFEVSDLVHNTVGCVIGYGFWLICHTIYQKIKKREKQGHAVRAMLLYQIPFVLVCGLFVGIFSFYNMKELGNMTVGYVKRNNMSRIKLSTEVSFSKKEEKAEVYKAKRGSKADTKAVANAIFAVHNTSVNESRTQEYTETMVYYDKGEQYSCWVDYIGLATWFTNYEDSAETNTYVSYSLNELKAYMKPYGIEIPDSATVTMNNDCSCNVEVNMTKYKDYYVNGELSCRISKNGEVIDFNNDLIRCEKYKSFPILSEQEAYEELEKGKFNYYCSKKGEEINVKGVTLKYLMDSKGFYQPAYDFDTVINKEESHHIYIAAIR